MATQLTPQLLRKLRTASHASKHFINACKRGLDGVIGRPDLQLDSQGDSPSQQQQDGDKDLTEEELREWREESERGFLGLVRLSAPPVDDFRFDAALQKVLPDNTIYFTPYPLVPSSHNVSHTGNNAVDSSSATTLLSQINAINLALTLEMFLPASTRAKYTMLTTQVPFI